MKHIHLFPDIETANTMGENGLDSPQLCMVKGKKVNTVKIDKEKFTCSFDSSGKINNVTPVLPTFTVALATDGNGTVSGAGTYTQGTVITITASANTGYKFKQWSDGDTNASRSIVVNNNISLSVSFEVDNSETWYFKIPGEMQISDKSFAVNFKCNGINYSIITMRDSDFGWLMKYNSTEVLGDMGWYNQSYRTIILEQPATGDLLTFLQANATKIS